jgi:hypothetical protein
MTPEREEFWAHALVYVFAVVGLVCVMVALHAGVIRQ